MEEKVVGGLFVHGGVLCVVVVQGVVVGGEEIQGVAVGGVVGHKDVVEGNVIKSDLKLLIYASIFSGSLS